MNDVVLRYLTEFVVPLAWPMIALAAIWTFKTEIREMLRRIEKAGPTGFEMSPQPSRAGGDMLGSEVSDPVSVSDDPRGWGFIQPWLTALEDGLERSGKSNDIGAIKMLAAAYDRRAAAQYILRTILGTQYEALLRIVDEPQSLQDLDDLFRRHKAKAGERAYPTSEAWVAWLVQNGLSDVYDGKYEASNIGKSVVDLIVAHGLSARENFG